MKRKHVILFISILIISVYLMLWIFIKYNLGNLGNEAGNNDWTYRFNNSGYAVWHINSKTIEFGKEKQEHSLTVVVQSYISAFRYNERFIIVERLPDGKETKDNPDAKREYYIINVVNDELYGPYNHFEMEGELLNQNVGDLSDWISTYPRPVDSTFSQKSEHYNMVYNQFASP